MKKIVILLLFLGLFSLAGCSSTIKIQNKRVSEDKVYEAKLTNYVEGVEVIDGKLVTIYYLNLILKDVDTGEYNHENENLYYVKVYEEESTKDKLRFLNADIVNVKAKELLPGRINNN